MGNDASIPSYGYKHIYKISITWQRSQSMSSLKENTLASCSLYLGTWNLFNIMKVNKRQLWQTIKERYVQVQDISGLYVHPASFLRSLSPPASQ